MKTFKYGYIAPTSYLDLIPEDANFHLILAHLLKDKEYAAFYKAKAERGDMIICDNGAFEFKRSLDADVLMDLIDQSGVNPTHVVAPDYPFEPWQVTYESAVKFIEAAEGKPYKLMAVPQSEPGDYKGWLECYRELATLEEVEVIGMSILGIPNAFQGLTGTKDIATNRIFATAYMDQNALVDYSIHHHYLGLGDGPRELLVQRALGVMDTNDSSSPFWHGINGIEFDETATGLEGGKIQLEVDFGIERSEDPAVIERIQKNISWLEDIRTK